MFINTKGWCYAEKKLYRENSRFIQRFNCNTEILGKGRPGQIRPQRRKWLPHLVHAHTTHLVRHHLIPAAFHIQDLKHIHELDAEEIYSLLQCRREYICDMIEDLQDKLKHIDIKSDQVNTVRTMLYSEPSFLSLSLPAICAYELLNKENLSHLYDHEKELVILIQPQTPSRYDYGRFTAVPANPGTLLRPKDDAPRVYLHVLLKSSYEDPADNDLAIYYDFLKMHNYRPGPAIGRVLVSACEGRLMNYYDTYIEAIPFKTSTIFQKDGIS